MTIFQQAGMKMTNSGFLNYLQKGAAANLPVAASVAA